MKAADGAPRELPPIPADLPELVARALAEDIGSGDLTAQLIPAARRGRARVITREAAVLCGQPYVNACFAAIDPKVRIEWSVAEGAAVLPGQLLCEIDGPARALLTGERAALNFLQLLSATATAARAFATAVLGTGCTVLDTRKTIPGLRTAQKYAVRVGGAQNHRIGLFDAVLIKENHIIAAGGIAAAVARARAAHAAAPVEVEVETIDELRQALGAGADAALLDDFSLAQMREAVAINRAAPRPLKIEASGGIDADGIRAIAATGVDYVSVGAITKHVRAVDLSMRFSWSDP
ncbi:MAG TPA: carboxylating nicotinate-nucleotide diphosphorylase [Steroidobacteraceae bacterium]|nr:carboxylating nicotinate-nucleotide diphosphorylase [Steroidobacteraceae bacterium]